MVHTEIVLQGDRRKGLCGSFHLYVLLSLHSLVQSVTPTTAFHDTTCLFIDNLHLTVDHHILIVLVEHTVCFQQLLEGMYAFTLYGVMIQQFVFLVKTFLV